MRTSWTSANQERIAALELQLPSNAIHDGVLENLGKRCARELEPLASFPGAIGTCPSRYDFDSFPEILVRDP